MGAEGGYQGRGLSGRHGDYKNFQSNIASRVQCGETLSDFENLVERDFASLWTNKHMITT